MMNRYRVTGPRPVLGSAPGEELEHEFSAEEEQDLISSGRIEIVPRAYVVVGTSRVFGAAPGQTFTAALTVGQESALIDGGHIERFEPRPSPQKQSKPEPARARTERKE